MFRGMIITMPVALKTIVENLMLDLHSESDIYKFCNSYNSP